MKKSKLYFDKCVGFDSDGALTMIGKQNGFFTRLKGKVNIFLTPFIVWYIKLTYRLCMQQKLDLAKTCQEK